MLDNKTFQEATVGAVVAISKESYKDLAQPAMQNLGKTGGSTTRLLHAVFGRGMDAAALKFELFWDEIEALINNKTQTIPESERIEPSLGFVASVNQGILSSIDSKELQELFTNLICSSMDKRTANGLLMVYPEILRQLTSDEAKILQYLFVTENMTPIINIVNAHNDFRKGAHIVEKGFTLIAQKANCQFCNNVHQYLDNLQRLNLVEISMLINFNDKSRYDELKNNFYTRILKEKIEKEAERHCEIEEGIISLTELGVGFCKACGIS